eukprot:CAMPEP_0174333096 /NCGR_PEP_ID=MMETSP0810-20121108/18855_1 /TAXON_ID=73025 ORGANISM="Eutreptiella gymnastica-like, Strain CCMP1594" /NCGR_SAMPLE_ID=MMETSP0810 /ASSEMBLY_ACC=CAM_ASM_000659 /LENGTH=162 /DNA_ID=CAMNT_0015449961 /DNA_START=89 /DNA_END=577 /DNA_ORIENTATION=-
MVRSSGPIQSSGSIYKRGHDKTLHCTWEMVRYTFNTTPTLLGGQKPGKNGVYSGRGLGAGDRTCQQGRQTGPLERTESLSELRNGCAWRSDAMGSEGKCRVCPFVGTWRPAQAPACDGADGRTPCASGGDWNMVCCIPCMPISGSCDECVAETWCLGANTIW